MLAVEREVVVMEPRNRASPVTAMAESKSRPNPHHQSDDLVCDIFSDIMTLAEDNKKKSKKVAEEVRLTFPQIWVESICESSEEDDAEDGEQRSRGEVIRSLHQTSSCSTDVSFEGSLSVGSSTDSGGGGGEQGCNSIEFFYLPESVVVPVSTASQSFFEF